MLRMIEEFRRGWAEGRAAPGDTGQAQRDGPNTHTVVEERKTFAEVSALADQLDARVVELEAELAASPAALFADVLRLPGVKLWLRNRYHPDKADVNGGERQWLTEAMQKVNAAYDALEKEGRPRE
jgi:hypothetical protein